MDKQQQKQLKVFGYGLPLILAFLGARHGLKHSWDTLSFSLLALAVVLLAIALWSKPLLLKIFGYWMKVAHAIGAVVTTVILVVVYYVVFTPVACVLRLMGKDFMCRRLDKAAVSYWSARNNSLQPTQQEYTKQF